jgi:CheY-like chemotaxis protein
MVCGMPASLTPHHLRADALPRRRPDRHPVRSGEPQHPDAAKGPAAGRAEPGVQPRGLPRILTGLRILIVDDDPDILDLFAVALAACGGEITSSGNATDALALAIHVRPHVIVSDIAMVGEDGYWLVRRLRQLPVDAVRTVPIVAATAYGREHSRAQVLAAGFTEHLQKPVDPEELCRVVAKLAGR